MTGNTDRSTQETMRVTELLIRNREPVPNIKHNGKCHYCESPVENPKLYCDGDCATEHDKILNACKHRIW